MREKTREAKEHSTMDATRFDSLSKAMGKSSSRRRAIKLLGSGVATGLAAAIGLSARGAEAMPRSNTPQHDFVSECKSSGGESSRVRTYVVKCSYACAFYTVCDFSTSPPICYDQILNC
jgi:hypothetical protein